MAQNQATNETGVVAPARIVRSYWSTYTHAPSGKIYRQTASPIGNAWEEITDEGAMYINDLLDVDTTPNPGDVLSWDGLEWTNIPIAAAVDLGQSIYVSAKGKTIANGAVRESISNHFVDVNEAMSVAQYGDTIYIFSGTYSVSSNLYKPGVNLHGFGKPILAGISNNKMFDNGGVSASLTIRGNIIFKNVYYAFDAVNGSIFNFSGANNKIDVTCESIEVAGAAGIVLRDTLGKIIVNDYIKKTANDHLFLLYDATSITVTAELMISTNTSTTNFDSLIWLGGGYSGTSTFNVKEFTKTVNTFCLFRIGDSDNSVGTLIINGFINDQTSTTGFYKSAIWVTSSNKTIIHNGDGYTIGCHITIYGGGSNTYIHKSGTLTSFSLTATNFPITSEAKNDNIFEISGEVINDGTATTMVYMGGGTGNILKLIDCAIINNTSDAGGTRGTDVSGTAKAIFNNAKIIMDTVAGTQESIYAGAAKDIKILQAGAGSNVAANVNITNIITGTSLIVDTDFE